MGHYRLQKIIHKGFTRYWNACILIESVHRLPRENTNSAGKPRNGSICFFTSRGEGLAYVVIWGWAIILGTFWGLLPDFWVPFWAIPGFLGIIFLVKFDFFQNIQILGNWFWYFNQWHCGMLPAGLLFLISFVEKSGNSKRIHSCAELKDAAVRGATPPPPPIIFERPKLPQQIIYRRKGNLSESLNHLKYRENIVISRFYEQCSRSSRNFNRPFLEVRKNFILLEHKHIIYHFEAGDLEVIAKIKPIMYFAKFLNAFVKPRNLNFSRKNYIFGIPGSPASKWYLICLRSKSLKFFDLPKGPKFRLLQENCS